MASRDIEAQREKWRAGFDPRRPLAEQLDQPHAPAWQLAHVMNVGEHTVYSEGKAFDAAVRAGDLHEAARHIPCIIIGATHRFPTAAFILWWESAGRTAAES